jgi:YHS domain-containing protein
MTKFTKTIMLLACAALIMQTSVASAQSKQKTAASASMKKESVSRAFTNGFNVPSTGVALEGYCPVCYIEANKAAKGSPEFSYDHGGVTYWFVSDAVRKTFVANPNKYVPAYGGWCAVGVTLGQRFPVDPTNFKVVNGRIMLFLKNAKIDAVDLWNKEEAENLKKADANWEKMKG